MNCFFTRFLKKIYFLILFVMLSLLLVNFSTLTIVTNHNVTTTISRMMNEKDFLPILAYVNCVILTWLSMYCLKMGLRKEFKPFSKQINLKNKNNDVYLFTKKNKHSEIIKCSLQLRI